MGCTIHVNGAANSLVHKGSNGFSMSTVPDVCKTPSPGGPVPIPYPVIISRSADLSKGTKKVKVDGNNPAAVKGSQFTRCNGDEPGTAGGVKSSTNMKEAKWLLYSFDVKMEGKNACRLGDKMTMNHGNTLCLSGAVNPPVIRIDMEGIGKTQEEACEKLEEKRQDDPKKDIDAPDKNLDKAFKKAGMRPEDGKAIRRVCAENNAIVSFRKTNSKCMPYIGKRRAKGVSVKAKTQKDGLARAKNGKKYVGDYDMHDMMTPSSGRRIRGGSTKEKRLIRRMNKAMKTKDRAFDRIKHGAQANYQDYLDRYKSRKPVKKLLRPDLNKKNPLIVFGSKKDPKAVYLLDTKQDLVNLYRCNGTDMPEHWDIRDKATDQKIKAKIT